MRARILAQGDEILNGATLDTNSGWLAAELWARGVRVVGMAAARDDGEALVRLFLQAAADCELLVSTGGLGPTTDDCTAEAAARAAGVELALSDQALVQVQARFAALGRPMPASNRKQAMLPAGADVLENPVGTAPGFAMDLGAARAFFFPGVPRELYAMVPLHLLPWLQAQPHDRGLAAPLRRRLHCCGVGESALQDRLADLALPAGVTLGYQARIPYVTVVAYGDPAVPGSAEALEGVLAGLRARLGADLFGEDDDTLSSVLGRALQARGWTLALAESCTAGGAAALVTETPGSSAWFRGGVVAYDNAVKRDLLGVSEDLLAREGAVSEACALALARGVREAAGADLGLSITGVAGPGGGTIDKPVGMVCFGLAGAAGESARTVRYGDRGRDLVRSFAAASALDWLRRRLA